MQRTKTIILARVSKDTQDYQRQIDDLTKIAERRGWTVVAVVKAKISATKTTRANRRDLTELFELVNKYNAKRLIVTEITRIGRKSREIRQVIDELTDLDVSVFISTIGMETLSGNDIMNTTVEMILGVLSQVAQMEAQRLSERIKSGQAAAKKKGVVLGRPKGQKEDFQKKIDSTKSYQDATKMLKEKWKVRKIAEVCKISTTTVMKIKNHYDL